MADWNEQIIDEFRTNGGTVTTNGFGRSLVLMHHRGARSGESRISPARAVPDGKGAWFVAASKGGAPSNPAWYYNLLAHPDLEIETPDDGTVAVHAVELTGAERDAAWELFKEASEGFRSYEQKTTRVIPVLRLTQR